MPNRGKYNTKQKELIIKTIIKQKHEFTIKDIYQELKEEVGLTTIYRLIDKLTSQNILNKYISQDNKTYYQYLKECEKENHFFLKCKKCSNLIHIDCDCINELFNHIFKEHSFKPNKDHIIINGICNNCLNKN